MKRLSSPSFLTLCLGLAVGLMAYLGGPPQSRSDEGDEPTWTFDHYEYLLEVGVGLSGGDVWTNTGEQRTITTAPTLTRWAVQSDGKEVRNLWLGVVL